MYSLSQSLLYIQKAVVASAVVQFIYPWEKTHESQLPTGYNPKSCLCMLSITWEFVQGFEGGWHKHHLIHKHRRPTLFRKFDLLSLLLHCQIYYNLKESGDLPWNHVGICMLNSGAIRTAIDERYKNGTSVICASLQRPHYLQLQFLFLMPWYFPFLLGSITMEEILTVLPFGGTFDLVQLKGSTVKKAFEHSIHRYGSMSGEFLQVSGLSSGKPLYKHIIWHFDKYTRIRRLSDVWGY